MYHGKLQSLVWDAMLVDTKHGGRKPAKPSGVHFGYFKAFLLPAELSHTDIDVSITCQLIRPKKKKHEANRCFHVRDMFRAAESFCHAVRKNLKFKLLYFQNEECYPAENKQADWNFMWWR